MMNALNQYDYIIAGMGCAGLSLVMHMLQSGKFSDKKILLIDKEQKNRNDRTWCFWEKETSLFEPIVHKEWKQLSFYSETLSKELSIDPYTYKLIRGIDFYDHCIGQIKKHPNIFIEEAVIEEITSKNGETCLTAQGKRFYAPFIFNSILLQKPQLREHQYWLMQHFTGWVVETEKAVFDPSLATLMDFRTDQSEGATFFYVLPFSENKALIEYTLFSKRLLNKEAYRDSLKGYIQNRLNILTYTIVEEEFGIIPMTNYSFPLRHHNIINIGTAGGQTKASSGYTFRFIQKQSEAIVKGLIDKGNPSAYLSEKKRFQFYDSVLLNILHYNKMRGDRIFTQLFKTNKAADVLAFLDNDTSVLEEMKIISGLPTRTFLMAAIKQISKSVSRVG